MTQIKLRRDTSANFTSKNPILGAGEPAYETDTKKLKIGDGTTAYTQLEYFSAGGGGSANIGAALPLKIVDGVISLEVDGQTIQVVDGKLAASTDMVTTNTTQTITGDKTFRYIGIDDVYGGKTRLGDGQSKIKMAYDGQISLDSATILADQSQNWRVGRYNKAGLIYSASPLKRVGDGPTFTNYDILDSSNLGSYVDGTTITYANNKLSTTVGGVEVCDIGMSLYVDETKGLRRYLNGQIVDRNTNTEAFFTRLQQITTLHPSLLCTEEEWRTAKTMSAFGQVGKFVFNYSGDDIVSVRIPRVVNAQGLFDLQNLGMTVSAGLPNITGKLGYEQEGSMSVDGAVYFGGDASQRGSLDGVNFGTPARFNAALSNPIYGKSSTVQQEAIQYPYFIQIATGSETENNIINDIELNNPYSLFDSKYSDHELNNLSWLKSGGQWNVKAVYTDAYDKLLKVYNGTETVAGLSVKLSTETYTDYDFVLNTTDETFRLPLLNGKEVFPQYEVFDTKDLNTPYTATENGFIYGLLNTVSDSTSTYIMINDRTMGTATGAPPYSDSYIPYNYFIKKGDTYKLVSSSNEGNLYYSKAIGNGTLYYYVGETVQNANLIDAGRMGEQLANKVDISNTQWAASACMPDYSAGVTTQINTSNPYQTPFAGWLFLCQNSNPIIGKVTNIDASVSSDMSNSFRFFRGYWDGNNNSVNGCAWIFVPKGLYLKLTEAGELLNQVLYPLKGVQ